MRPCAHAARIRYFRYGAQSSRSLRDVQMSAENSVPRKLSTLGIYDEDHYHGDTPMLTTFTLLIVKVGYRVDLF